ncbi:MAG: glutamine synthetase family protein [Pseudomonadota bacterium]
MSQPTDWMDQLPHAARTYIEGIKLEEVECIIADIPGISRGKAMPALKFSKMDQMYLPDSIFFQTITGEYADVEGAKNQWTEGDMVLKPDLTSATAAPWTGDVTLQIIHDAFDHRGRPISFAPRNVLRHVIDLYRKEGWEPVVAPEMEFYLVAPNTDPNVPIKPPLGRTGRAAASRQAYSMSAVDEYGPVIDDIYDFAEAQGLEIDTIIQEGGAGQIEINLIHGDPVRLADEVFYFKRLIKEAALRHNCFATFMAKPMSDQPGSAMHVHHSVVDTKTGKNIFSDESGEATDMHTYFIGGLQKHLPAAAPFYAPYVNSYRRYVAGYAAPINLEWGDDNRTTGIRVPISAAEARRVENRVAGMDCNPYIGIAASLACGYLGMKNKIEPRKATKREAYHGEREIPATIHEALALLDEDTGLREVMGTNFVNVYSSIKQMENEEFVGVISPWEREHLLMNV